MTDFAAGIAIGVVIGGFIVAICLGAALDSLYKRLSVLEKAGNSPEPPETAQTGV